MSITIEAIYEAGVFKPLSPLTGLAEHSRVRLTIELINKPVPKVRYSSRKVVDLSKEREWILKHRDEYRGQWVVLDGERLIGHTDNSAEATAIFKQARAEGVEAPFVELIPLDDEPIWMMWL